MKCIFAFLFISTVFIIKVNAQNISNEGSEFWLCFPSHVPASTQGGNQLAEMSVFITSKSNTSGVVTCGTYSQPFTVQANTVKEVQVPRNNSYINDGTGFSINKGIKVIINAGLPKAVVYGHVFAGARSAATLVLPLEALGQKYYAVAYDQSLRIGGSQSQFQIVCVEANTVLNITPRINGQIQTSFQITLANVGDVYQYQNNNDITGTYIEVDTRSSSCKRFAAFSGSSALAIFSPGCVPPGGGTNNNPSYDPLFQQLYPLESWGTTFPLIPFTDRNAGAIFRVLASENNTKITLNGISVTRNAGEFYEPPTPINSVSVITADKPVSVTQYALTQYCADSRNRGNNNFPSDPDMVIINPLEYSIKNVTMYSSTKLAIRDQFLNVMIPNAGVASFKINGISRSNLFSVVPNNTQYSYAQINLITTIGGGTNFNLISDVGFNAIAYGFGDFESYAYSAGTNLASSVFINAVRPATNEIINNACKDENFDFRLVLPYLSTKLVWTLDAGDGPITQEGSSLTPNPITINGKSLFEYRLPISKVYTTVGIKNIKIISTRPPTAGGCPSGDDPLNFEFLVVEPPPITLFNAIDKACINLPVAYNLSQNNTGGPIINYFWDFGDGTVSTEKNPSHVFTSTGIKTVSLFVKNDVACVSKIFSLPIEIFAEPVANFSVANTSCTGEGILFTNQTVLNGNSGISYLWDFGDGSTSTASNPTHIYTSANTYNVTLKLKTAANCEAVITKTKVINASPTADIADPEACVNDNVTFQITNKSNDINSFTWDFGDGTNDVSQKNKEIPAHKYNAAGVYNVKLKLTSSNNCQTNLIKTITISGANPKSEFEVINAANLCSNIPVQFKDLSSIPFGNITKLEWVFNYTNGGSNQIFTVDNPIVNAVYEFKYPASKNNLNYQIKLRAYSGNICFTDFGPITITVKGSPDVVFNPLTNICINEGAFKLTQASDISGIAGTGVYTGTGVTPMGFFDPVLAGAGTFNISYTFNAANGCSAIKAQSITVYELPVVSVGAAQIVILTGGQATLKATATGKNLTYKWTPSLGLDKDDILNPIATPEETTLYTLTVTSEDGCIVSTTINVNVVGFPDIPNTFTPNNDAVNDVWNIKYLESYVNGRVTIFNRYGTQVFASIGYNIPWDGKTNGKDVPIGTYYYIIDPRNGSKKFSGSVTVIR